MSEPLAPVDLVLLWHHHQPDYRRPADGVSLLPWARLHATKDYVDMARHVERHPGLRATFNLVPALVDQVEDAGARRAGRVVRPACAPGREPRGRGTGRGRGALCPGAAARPRPLAGAPGVARAGEGRAQVAGG